MPSAYPYRWGQLKIIAETTQTTQVVVDGKNLDRIEDVWVLKCRCGELRTMPTNEFPGRDIMRDCGCGLDASKRHYRVNTSVNENTYRRLDAYSRRHTVSQYVAIERLLEFALDCADIEDGIC